MCSGRNFVSSQRAPLSSIDPYTMQPRHSVCCGSESNLVHKNEMQSSSGIVRSWPLSTSDLVPHGATENQRLESTAEVIAASFSRCPSLSSWVARNGLKRGERLQMEVYNPPDVARLIGVARQKQPALVGATTLKWRFDRRNILMMIG